MTQLILNNSINLPEVKAGAYSATEVPLTVQVTLALAWALLTEAGLSFLGLGTQPPAPSLGLMMSEARNLMQQAPWLLAFPGLTIMLGILGFNLFGDALRDILDPKSQGRAS